MKRIKNNLTLIMALITLFIPVVTYAEPGEPPGGFGGGPGGTSSSSVTHTGATTFTSDTTESNKTYSSTTGGENALLVSGGTSTLNSCTVNKSGDSSGDDADFYGTNAAILAYNGATLNIKGGSITTNGSHANAVFAYGTGVINISDATINTSSNNSGGVMVTGGGTLTTDNLTVSTSGNSSAAIRSDRGGGTLTVNGGTYETSGTGSPAIYSTADITVNDATLTSTASEGVIVEGANSVTLNNVTLTDTNNTLNGNSETYKNIFLYQSMSGDADEGTSSFTAKDSKIVTNIGDTIFVTNTKATITLENNTISNAGGALIRIQAGKWGTSGSNGGNVTLNLVNQNIGANDVIVDNISTLNLSLSSGSVLETRINNENTAKEVTLSLSSDSVLSLVDDSYVTTLNNEVSDNSNIYLNGHKLYVNGTSIEANNGSYDGNNTTDTITLGEENNNDYISYIVGFIVGLLIVILIVTLVRKRNKKISTEM